MSKIKINQEHLDKIKHVPITKPERILNMDTKNVDEVILLICEFVNDIVNKASIIGYLDNLPMVYAAWEGKELIIPELKDYDETEMEALKVKVKDKLQLKEGIELVVEKAINLLWSGKELADAIAAATSQE